LIRYDVNEAHSSWLHERRDLAHQLCFQRAFATTINEAHSTWLAPSLGSPTLLPKSFCNDDQFESELIRLRDSIQGD
jgi:hypothetical protein